MVACAACVHGTYWVWKLMDTGGQVYVEEKCDECLGMGNVPRVRPPMEGIIHMAENKLAVTDAPITWDTLVKLAKSPTIPERYKGKPTDLLAAIFKGREMGIAPMEAIGSIYLVNGRASMEGKLMIGLVLQAGHIITVRPGADKAVVIGKRWHEPSQSWVEMGEIEFTLEDAKRAGLDKKDTYKSYPQYMLAWRAVTFACRLWFADVISGIGYTPEEIGLDDRIEELPVEVLEAEVDLADQEEADEIAEEAEVVDE